MTHDELPDYAPFIYRDFHDYPRTIVVCLGNARLLLDCPFDPELDEYPNRYRVHRLPQGLTPPAGSWAPLLDRSTELLGSITVRSVEFDESRRRYIRTATLTIALPALSTDF